MNPTTALAEATEFESWLAAFRSTTSSSSATDRALQRQLGALTLKHASKLEFTVFPLLPKELRLRIWSHAQPGPQFVEVRCGCEPFTEVRLSVLLSVNRESREQTLRKSVPILQRANGYRELGSLHIDLALDTLLISYGFSHWEDYMDRMLNGISNNVLVGLKHLAIDLYLWEEMWETIDKDSDHPLLKLRNLEKITLCIPGFSRSDGDISLFGPYGSFITYHSPPYPSEQRFVVNFSTSQRLRDDWSQHQVDLLLDMALWLGPGSDRRSELCNILWNAQQEIDNLEKVDPSWKVPNLDIKGLQRGKHFSS